MERVLITGATGFIGSSLTPLLARGFEIVALGRRKPDISGVDWRPFDLLQDDLEVIRELRCKTLVHLAWSLPHGNYWTEPANLAWLRRSTELARIFVATGGRHVHMAGTCAEYDWSQPMPLTVTGRLKPVGLYGKCKNALRSACARICAAKGATLGWYRFFWLYGGTQDAKKFLPALIRSLAAGLPTRCRSANLERDYLHVEDAAALLALAIGQKFSGSLNVASGLAVSLGEMAQKIAHALHREDLLTLEHQPVSRANPLRVQADIEQQKNFIRNAPAARKLDAGIVALVQQLCNKGS